MSASATASAATPQRKSCSWRAFIKPRRLELDYLAPRRRLWWPGALLLVVSLSLAAGLLARYRNLQLELEHLETAGSLIAAPPRMQAIPEARLADGVKSAEAVARQLALPWAELIRAVEQAGTRHVALLHLEPDAAAGVVRLSAEATQREAMFDYVRRLGAHKGMGDVHLVSHELRQDDPRRPVRFAVEGSLR